LVQQKPIRVNYWGSPVVIFRTESGRIGALEDVCPHRRVPLSSGTVRGEELRCTFHGFTFDTEGRCVSIPAFMGVDSGFRSGCGIRRYLVREALGLAWISNDPAALFPEDLPSEPDTEVSSLFFEVGGDVRVWMDHWLDITHGILAHANSIYNGSPEDPAEFDARVNISEKDSYPVPRAVEVEIRPRSRLPLWFCVYQAGGVLGFLKRRLSGASRRGPFRVRTHAGLLSPVFQDWTLVYETPFGTTEVRFLNTLNPRADGATTFSTTAMTRHRSGPLGWIVERYILARRSMSQIKSEDAPLGLVDDAGELGELRLTPYDRTVESMRIIADRYLEERAHLFPKGSLVHRLRSGQRLRLVA
jgi:nitrite reductase/ring-hydroxylating ferredoxin subunit